MKILIGVLVVALAGLGGATALIITQQGGSPHGKQAAAPTSTSGAPLASPTTTTAPTATATSNSASACGAQGGAPLTIHQLHIIDFAPRELLSDTLPLKPILTGQVSSGEHVTTGNNILVGVDLNLPPASQVGIVCQVSLRLTAFQPLASSVSNVRDDCDAYYENPGGPMGGGCGGGAPADGGAALTFPTAQVGTTLTAPVLGGNNQPAQISTTSANGGTLDITLQVALPGTYTFLVGLWQDSSGPKWSNLTIHQIILLGHASHLWGGQACATPAMQAQLPPPTNPPGEFICPGGPPQN